MASQLVQMGLRSLAGVLLALLLFLASPVGADNLSTPAEARGLAAVSVPDLSAVEQSERPRLEQARKALNEALDDGATAVERLALLYGRLAALYHVHQIYQPAQQAYVNATVLAPGEFRWHYYAGHLAEQTGRPAEALDHWRRAGRIDPEYRPLTLRLAQAHLELEQFDPATEYFQKLLSEPGLKASAAYGLGQIALLQRDYQAAADHFQQVLAADPKARQVHYPLAQALRRLGQKDAARRHLALKGKGKPAVTDPVLGELNALNSGARLDFGRAMKAMRAGRHEEAARGFAAGLKKEPGNAAARTSYARTLYLSGQGDLAATALSQAHKDDPSQTLAPFLLGVWADSENRDAEARDFYAKVLAREPQHSGAHFFLANQYFRGGDYALALAHYEKVLAVEPGNGLARYLEIISRQRQGEGRETLSRRLEQGIREHPEQAILKYLLSRLLAIQPAAPGHNAHRAMELAGELASSPRPIPPHLSALALAKAALGDFEEAARLTEQVIQAAFWIGDNDWLQNLSAELAGYQDGMLPGEAWSSADPLCRPPGVNLDQPMRHYPASVPF